MLAPLTGRPERAAILCDFDGTLSPLVLDPAAARPLPGAADALAALAERYAVVAVISGRPASFLTAHFHGKVLLSGLYGLESARDGVVTRLPEAEPWAPVIATVTNEAATQAPAGVIVEPKGLSLTIHWRPAPQHAGWATAFAADAAARTGLVVHDAKASVELRVPVERDKGTVVAELAAGVDVALFVGDDVGDLSAVAAVRALPIEGVVVVVGGPETPAALLDQADTIVDGPAGALDLLKALLI